MHGDRSSGAGRSAGDGVVPVSPVRVPPTHELVLDQLRMALALGRFCPGDSLPRERDLAEMLQVSRVTVRAALAILSAEGVIDVRRGRGGGAFVTDRALTAHLGPDQRRQSRDRLRQTFEYRKVIETATARFAAERRSNADVVKLKDLVAAIDDVGQELTGARRMARLIALDHEFHLAIACTARNEWLVNATREVRLAWYRPIGAVFSRGGDHINDQHAEIVDAIERGDADAAAEWMHTHLEKALEIVEAHLEPR